jgi:photosystem II stability/assembly factor-like uncharacterized protein
MVLNYSYCQTGWYQVNSGTTEQLKSIFFLNDNTGFTTGTSGVVLKTTNGGLQWTNVVLTTDTLMTMRNVYFKDQLTGYILANYYPLPNPKDSFYTRVFKTTNAGNNWFIEGSDIKNVWMKNIEFIDSQTGYMSGGLYLVSGPNKIYKTTNGGTNWVELPELITISLLSQKFINASTGFIGAGNKIFKTTNGGVNWSVVFVHSSNEYNLVYSIKFLNSNTGCASGGPTSYSLPKNRFIAKTTDGGNNWNYVLNDTLGWLINNITIVNENIVYGCGSVNSDGGYTNSGKIIKTINGGATWTEEVIPGLTPLSSVINNNTKGFAVGINGIIYKKDNLVSVTQISTEVPSSINLYQNYPNPFNPETTIKFDITKSGFISLKVYDIAGKEVQNLFTGVKEAGSYQLKFDGANLNSGVYFYRLTTEGNTITKSMVLVK